MASSSRSLWRCSTCTFAENELASMACTMCGTIIHDKRPVLPCPGAGVAVVRPNKLLRKTAEEDTKKQPPPPDVAIAKELHHPSGVVVTSTAGR